MSEISSISVIDVAKAAGVGVGTVSRVINQHPSVSREAHDAVQRAMALLNYTPPPPGRRRGFRSHPVKAVKRVPKHREVTLIILSQYGMEWILRKAPVFASVLQGIQTAVEENGAATTIRQATDWNSLLVAVRQSGGAPCLIMGEEPPGEPPGNLRFAPAVWVMGSIRRFEGDHVQPDHFSLGQIAAMHFLSNGHRHAAYIGVPVNPVYHVSFRGAAFQWWLEHGGATVSMLTRPDIVRSGPKEHRANEEALRDLIGQFASLAPRPTALLLQADMLAPHVYELLRERGLRPMEDVEILTCNHEPAYLSHLKPQPVVLDLQAESIGRRAVTQAIWRIEHPHEASMRIMIEPLLIPPLENPVSAAPASA
ncbi:MAG TPA: LacI family DNA-binding transcriptional regulator [Terrimicrobiaceae bacterium]|nr:LacI family DNA-binding transcriptional regulator [Terrimicrobiaceae bacterium]